MKSSAEKRAMNAKRRCGNCFLSDHKDIHLWVRLEGSEGGRESREKESRARESKRAEREKERQSERKRACWDCKHAE